MTNGLSLTRNPPVAWELSGKPLRSRSRSRSCRAMGESWKQAIDPETEILFLCQLDDSLISVIQVNGRSPTTTEPPLRFHAMPSG